MSNLGPSTDPGVLAHWITAADTGPVSSGTLPGIERDRTVSRSLSTEPSRAVQPESAPSPPSGLPLPEFARQFAESGQVRPEDRQDAWFASYGTSISRALSSPRSIEQSDTLRTMVAESVIGSDDRVEIEVTRQLPYQWVCDLSIIAANGTLWLGTGWLAAPGLVVTAGHCVYLHNQGGWVARVEIQPARNGPDIPFSFVSHTALSVSGWVDAKDSASDYGALILSRADAEQGIGYFGYAALSDTQLSQRLINLVGYPMDKPSGTLWGHARSLSAVAGDELIYQNDTFGGMSGCPVIGWDGADYQVLGIHNYGDLAGNRATRITPGVFGNIQAWAAQAGASA